MAVAVVVDVGELGSYDSCPHAVVLHLALLPILNVIKVDIGHEEHQAAAN